MLIKIDRSWYEILQDEIKKPYIEELKQFLEKEIKEGKQIFPDPSNIFRAFSQTAFQQVKVVIVGQDPYHGIGQADGLAFSVPYGVPPPPSLKNIFKEIEKDLGIPVPTHGTLNKWAQQGVLLLNTTLTVRAGEPKSHYGKGWELLTDAIIQILAARKDPMLFLLWGKTAQEKEKSIEGTDHIALKAAHPSPYSVKNFLGCRHFSKTNSFLEKHGKKPIDWSLG